MVEILVNELMIFLQDKVPEELIVFVISLMPVLECRGGMIAARLMEIPFLKAFLICYFGNVIPIPFIILFIRKIFDFLRKFKFFEKIILKLEAKTEKNKDKILKYESLGLLLFVAIPLPGTGGWTGALMAALLDIRFKRALPIIALGVLIAGFIMSAVTYGIFQI
jgi:uncharacterized membrane protein